MTQTEEFAALGLSERMLEAIEAKGFEAPSPIQKLTIPVLLKQECDIIAQAGTGTGKTAAFGLPLLELLGSRSDRVPRGLIVVPTRELALQVADELHSFNRDRRLAIAAIYGGAPVGGQLRRLARGTDIVVGTPGRILDHIRRGSLDLSRTEYLVLDEADEMLDMGFIEDIEQIIAGTSPQRRVLLFSATMPERIVALSQNYMRDTVVLRAEPGESAEGLTEQIYFEVRESDKFDALVRLMDVEDEFYGIVFCRTRAAVDELTGRLQKRGCRAEGLHGDISQGQREQILGKFRERQCNILVATDVAARGIDIDNLTHVVNYSLPQDAESYIHRIGRTGRAGRRGCAITLVSGAEARQFGFLRRTAGATIRRGALPSPREIVAARRHRIMESLGRAAGLSPGGEYAGMADEILSLYEPAEALGALLRMAYGDVLDESSYPEIRQPASGRRGGVRIFLSVGRLDGYDPRRMAELLKRECALSDSEINDVRVAGAYSFVTLPESKAAEAVRRLNASRQGDRPLARSASIRQSGRDGNTPQFNEGFDWSFFERGGNTWGPGRNASKGAGKKRR